MKVTIEELIELGACEEGREWFLAQDKSELVDVLIALNAEEHWDWANWTIACFLTPQNAVRYAIFAAEQVSPIFEKERSDDNRPRAAIEAAKACLAAPTSENGATATTAARAAFAAANARVATAATATAAYTAASNARSASEGAKQAIFEFGLSLAREEEKRE